MTSSDASSDALSSSILRSLSPCSSMSTSSACLALRLPNAGQSCNSVCATAFSPKSSHIHNNGLRVRRHFFISGERAFPCRAWSSSIPHLYSRLLPKHSFSHSPLAAEPWRAPNPLAALFTIAAHSNCASLSSSLPSTRSHSIPSKALTILELPPPPLLLSTVSLLLSRLGHASSRSLQRRPNSSPTSSPLHTSCVDL